MRQVATLEGQEKSRTRDHTIAVFTTGTGNSMIVPLSSLPSSFFLRYNSRSLPTTVDNCGRDGEMVKWRKAAVHNRSSVDRNKLNRNKATGRPIVQYQDRVCPVKLPRKNRTIEATLGDKTTGALWIVPQPLLPVLLVPRARTYLPFLCSNEFFRLLRPNLVPRTESANYLVLRQRVAYLGTVRRDVIVSRVKGGADG